MASDNKNISSLAAEAADDPTSDLQVLSVELMPTDDELEVDADTFSLEEQAERPSVSVLQSDLRTRDERISNLQFDIEKLRSRWSGLEKEIAAREELTEILQQELKAAHKSLAAKDKQLVRLERRENSLSSKLDAATSAKQDALDEASNLAGKLDELTQRSDETAQRIETLENELETAVSAITPPSSDREQEIVDSRQAVAELNAYIDGRKADWERQRHELETLSAALAQKDSRLSEQAAKLTESEARLSAVDAERERLDALLTAAQTEIQELKSDLRVQRDRMSNYENGERGANQRLIAEQAGALADGAQQIAMLTSQIERSDRYANELREKLTDADEVKGHYVLDCVRLTDALEEANARIDALDQELEIDRTRANDLETSGASLKQEFDDEIATLRKELEEAHAAIESHDSINEQLTSDLIDSRELTRTLKEKLESAQKTSIDEIEPLESRIRELEERVQDYEHKITNKDNAISALLSELASNSRSIESIELIEDVIHEIDDQMSERIDDRAAPDRDRPTRLLIGYIDGQELRFPLFKDRLTIGRTAQNDIQLRAQYISRRHAVVIVDDDGTRIVDWGSKNGIYVNNARVSEQSLRSGDTVMIGTAEFVYEERPRRELQ